MKKLLLTLFSVFFLSFATAAYAECKTAGQIIEIVKKQRPEATFVHLKKNDAKVFLNALNEIPPASNIAAEEVLVFTSNMRQTSLLVQIDGGCMKSMGRVPKEIMHKAMTKAAQSF